jgi:hypothetical protein
MPKWPQTKRGHYAYGGMGTRKVWVRTTGKTGLCRQSLKVLGGAVRQGYGWRAEQLGPAPR